MDIKEIHLEHGTLLLPTQALLECHHQGNCDYDCEHWADRIDWSKQAMEPLSIARELADTGAWDEEELKEIHENYKRILWIAAIEHQRELEENEIHT